MNNSNLIPASERTHEDFVAMGRKGGIASGEARRERKRMLQALNWGLQRKSKVREGMTVEESIIDCATSGAEVNAEIALKLIDQYAKLNGEIVNKSEVEMSGNIPAVLTEEMVITDETEEKPKKSAKRTGKC